MPVVSLPADLKEQLENVSGSIDNTDGPGVAVYWATDRSVRADIYIGLTLDGLKLYQNISSVNPNIKMQFVPDPNVYCDQNDVEFYADEDEIITIKVNSRSKTYIMLSGLLYTNTKLEVCKNQCGK